MADINSLDKGAKDYFSMLPISVQELIMQSDASFKNKSDLEAFYRNHLSSREKM